MKRCVLRFIMLALLSLPLVVYPERQWTIGVLALRDKMQANEDWKHLTSYLESVLPGRRFALHTYTYEELEKAVTRRQVDFVLTHGAHYVQLSELSMLSSPLATSIERDREQAMPVYGGAIIVKADRKDLQTLKDLKGKTIATSSIKGFASYQMQAYELVKIGLSIPEDINVIEVELPLDRSVDAVLSGRADAAFVRIGLLEHMIDEGKVASGRLKVLNAQKLAGFGYDFSTTLYPLWPFAAMPQVGDELAAQVAAALLMLPHDGEVARACNIWGFTIPANYQPIKEVMQALRTPPFDEAPNITWNDLWYRYQLVISLGFLAVAIILLLLIWLIFSRRLLREGEQRLISLVDSAPDAIVLANEKGLIVGWNNGAQQLFGYHREEVIRQPLTLLMPRRYRARHSVGLQRIRAGEQPRLLGRELEMDGLRKDGSEFPFELVMGSWETSTGRHFSAIIRDISERRRVSLELEEYRHHLEDLVSERTAELEQAKNVAEAANRSKTVFLSNMSHELRTPLNAILGFTQIMENDRRIPEDLCNNISIINRSGNHLLALINDVLEISRIEAGRTTVNNDVFDLALLLQAVQEMIDAKAAAKNLALVVTLPDDLPDYVMGDAHHLRQVLLNLLGNAVKYTERGEIRLTITMGPDQLIHFEVKDTGLGIGAEDLENIFKAFYQTEVGIARGEGTGLGLSISREFVRLMGGELLVESILGRGSMFSFAIPLSPVTNVNEISVMRRAEYGRIVGLAPGQIAPRILVAEDMSDSQQVARQLLEQIGCEVCVAENGRVAVELFKHWKPDLILMDMRMPVMDGYQATRAIRALPNGYDIPILALTASAFQEDRDKVLVAGCNDILSKPFEARRLFDVIGSALGLRYEYEDRDISKPALTEASLRDLPVELRKELAEVAVELDNDAILEVVERLRNEYPAEAELIAELVDGFRFDKIMALYSDNGSDA